MEQETRQSSRLLIDDYPLIVLPLLAVAIGLSEAIALQQVHFLLGRLQGKVIDGKRWIHMTDREWHEQFPFWTRNTIRRILGELEKDGYVQTGIYNDDPLDRTTWYTVDYDKVASLPQKKQRKQRTDYPNFGQSMKEAKKRKTVPQLGGGLPLSKNRTVHDPKLGQDPETSSSETSSIPETDLASAANAGSRSTLIGEEFDEVPIPPKQADQIGKAQTEQAIKRLNDQLRTNLVNASEPPKEKVPPKRKGSNTPPNPTCFMGDGRYVGPFKSMAAAQRYSAGHGTVTDLSAVPAGVMVEAPPNGKKPKADVPPPPERTLDALVGLCYPDIGVAWKMPGVAARARQCYNKLAACCAPITPERIEAFGRKWYAFDFRGQKKQRPKLEQIPDAWLTLMTEDKPDATNHAVLDGDDPTDQRALLRKWGFA